MRNKFFFTIIFTLNVFFTIGQSLANKDALIKELFFGFGAGLDYGGLGLRMEFAAAENFSVFAGAGYNLVDLAYNAGVMYKINPSKKITPMLLAMYGYNAAIKFPNNSALSKTYYGFTLGAGAELKYKERSKLTAEVLFPLRNSQFKQDYENLKPLLENKILPITFSLGYNFVLTRVKNNK